VQVAAAAAAEAYNSRADSSTSSIHVTRWRCQLGWWQQQPPPRSFTQLLFWWLYLPMHPWCSALAEQLFGVAASQQPHERSVAASQQPHERGIVHTAVVHTSAQQCTPQQ
jgi:hypothetical protein